MQSLSRQLKRNNAVLIMNNVTKKPEFVQKTGHNRLRNHYLTKNHLAGLAEDYRTEVAKRAKKYQLGVIEERLKKSNLKKHKHENP